MFPTPKTNLKVTLEGAIRIPWDQNYVILCRAKDEWITWVMDPNGYCYWGHYMNDEFDARKDFYERCKTIV